MEEALEWALDNLERGLMQSVILSSDGVNKWCLCCEKYSDGKDQPVKHKKSCRYAKAHAALDEKGEG